VTAALLALSAGAVLAFHRAVLFPTWTDETVHLYVARRVGEGLALYRQIHSARPPLAVLPLALLLQTGLPSILAARAAVLAGLAATAAALLWFGRRQLGRWTGLAAAVLFLLAPEVASRSAYTAIQLVGAGSALCWAAALAGFPLLGGIAGGLALATGQHSAVLVAGTGLWILVRGRRGAARFAAGAAGALLLAFLPALVLAGPGNVYQDLIGHHLYHVAGPATPERSELGWYAGGVALEQLPLLALAAFALWPRRAAAAGSVAAEKGRRAGQVARPPEPQQPTRTALALLLCGHVAAVGLMRGGLVLYLFPALPLLALLAGDGLVRLARALGALPSPGRWWSAAGAAVALAALGLAGFAGSRARYQERDHELYPLLPHLRYVAMARLQRLVVAEAIGRKIGPAMTAEETIFGHPTISAGVALQTGRRISGEQADLAPRWIQQGTVSRKEVVQKAEEDHIRYFVTPRGFFELDPYFKEYLSRCFEPPEVFPRRRGDGRGIPAIDLYRRRDGSLCR
jgi:hypothetical protein